MNPTSQSPWCEDLAGERDARSRCEPVPARLSEVSHREIFSDSTESIFPAPLLARPQSRFWDCSGEQCLRRREPAFTLLELLVVMGLMAMLSFFLIGGLAPMGKSAARQSAQALLANLVSAARTQALASGQACRIVLHVDPLGVSEPRRYLRYVVLQLQTVAGWQTIADAFLPAGVYVVPGNFGTLPSGLFAPGTTVPWTKVDGSDLRSTALRSNQISTEAINAPTAEQWVSITLSAHGGTLQSGDLILAQGRRRSPATYASGEAPIELENPAAVCGLTLSAYGVPALINARSSF